MNSVDLKKLRDRRNRAISEYAVECGHNIDAADFLDNARPAVEFIESGIALDRERIEVIAEVADHYFDGAPHLRLQFANGLETLLTAVRRDAA